MLLDELKNKKVLILGFAREGQDTFLFLRKKFPSQVFGIADQNPSISYSLAHHGELVSTHVGKDYLKALKKYDVIIKSPGVPPRVIAPFLSKRQRVTSQTEIFFENCPGTIIGVTGTKGKSTTASLVYTVLKKGGVKAHLIGNIEKPVLGYLEKARAEDVFVYELSSFQLTNLKRSSHIAVLLNIYPEHLDYYGGSFKEYTNAKANIAKHQTETDFLIYNSKDPLVAKIVKGSKAQKLPFGMPKPMPKPGLGRRPKPGLGIIASVEPAILIGKLFGISQKNIQKAIKNFKPLPHRLEKIGEWKGITFYNDSLATIPEATCAALDLLGSKVNTLIAGGFDRGLTFEKLGKKIEKSSVKTLILFPTTGEKIFNALKSRKGLSFASAKESPLQSFFANTMKEAIQLCYAHTPKGSICLLSPAASSFNMFKDYKDRGEQFKKLARQYGEKQ